MNKKLKLEELNRKSAKDPIIVLLDNVRSLNNIGSVFRTCDAMGISKFIYVALLHNHHIEKKKTAIGATKSVDWNMLKCLRNN